MLPLSRHYQNDVPQLDGVPKWIYRRMSPCTEIDFPSCSAVSSELKKKKEPPLPRRCALSHPLSIRLSVRSRWVFWELRLFFSQSFTGVKRFAAPIKSFYVFVGFPFWISHTWLHSINKNIFTAPVISCDFQVTKIVIVCSVLLFFFRSRALARSNIAFLGFPFPVAWQTSISKKSEAF